MKNYTLILVSFFSAITLLISSFVIIYRSILINTVKEIRLVLENVLADDMSSRMANLYDNLLLEHFFDSKIGTISTYPRDTIAQDTTAEQHFQKMMQTYLRDKSPINMNTLDTLFQASLRKRNIMAETAIRYIYEQKDNQDTVDSKPNCKLYTNVYALQGIPLGLAGEMTIQGYAKVTPNYIIHRGKMLFITSGTLICFLTGMLIYASYRQVKQHRVPSTGLYKIDKYLTLNMDTLELQYKNQTVTLTPQSAQILKHFLEAPDYYLEYEELETRQWGNNFEVTRRREQAIARLRSSLDEISTLHLVSVRGSGYKLMIGSKWNDKQMETFPIEFNSGKSSHL